MIYPDLPINQKINAKGNAITLYRYPRMSSVRRNDGDRYCCRWLLVGKERFREPHGAGREPKY